MKKIILSISIAAIAIAGFMYEPTNENETSSDLTVENAEALATGDDYNVVTCYYDGYCLITDDFFGASIAIYEGKAVVVQW